MNESIEQIEGDNWGSPPSDATRLVKKCYELRRLPVRDLDIEDLRVLISQNIGLEIIIPQAISILEKDILAEGDYYEGDLLSVVLRSDLSQWNNNLLVDKLIKLYESKESVVTASELTDEIKQNIKDQFNTFKSKV